VRCRAPANPICVTHVVAPKRRGSMGDSVALNQMLEMLKLSPLDKRNPVCRDLPATPAQNLPARPRSG